MRLRNRRADRQGRQLRCGEIVDRATLARAAQDRNLSGLGGQGGVFRSSKTIEIRSRLGPGRGYRDHEYLLLNVPKATATLPSPSHRMNTGPAPDLGEERFFLTVSDKYIYLSHASHPPDQRRRPAGPRPPARHWALPGRVTDDHHQTVWQARVPLC